MKEIKSPETIKEYLDLDKRKYAVILTNKLFNELVKKIIKLEKRILNE